MNSDKNTLNKKFTTCKRCIYDDSIPVISFDENGVCNYCFDMIDSLIKDIKLEAKKEKRNFEKIISKIKRQGKNKKYDCVIGVSGGTDSSYMVYKAKKWGLRPLAVHYDNTWNSAIATQNIRKIFKQARD